MARLKNILTANSEYDFSQLLLIVACKGAKFCTFCNNYSNKRFTNLIKSIALRNHLMKFLIVKEFIFTGILVEWLEIYQRDVFENENI